MPAVHDTFPVFCKVEYLPKAEDLPNSVGG